MIDIWCIYAVHSREKCCKLLTADKYHVCKNQVDCFVHLYTFAFVSCVSYQTRAMMRNSKQGIFLKKKNCQPPDGNNQISSGRSKWTSFFPSSSSSSAASWSSCRSSKSRRCCMLKDVWAIFQHLFCMFPFMQCHRDLMFWVGKRKKVVKKFGHNWSIFRKGR